MEMKYVTIIVKIMTMTNANYCKMNARLLMENLASSLSYGEAASSYTVYLEIKEENLGVRPKLILTVNLFVENGEYAMIIVPLKRQKLVGLYKNQILYKVISEKNPHSNKAL